MPKTSINITLDNTKHPLFIIVVCSLFFSFCSSTKNNLKIPDGEYCERAGNIMAFCMSFKADTFHYGIVSMMFNYVGKGTYTLNKNILTLNFCKGDSSRYIDGTVRSGSVKHYKIKKISASKIIVRDLEQKSNSHLIKSK